MKKQFLLLLLIVLVSCTPKEVRDEEYSLEVFFCPDDGCLEKIISVINNSKDTKCAFYELNLPELIDLLKEKNAQVVIEDKNELEGFHSGYSSALMHNKFCVLDNITVITGSMNPTERGNYYNNNNLVLINSDHLAKNYLAEFNELYTGVYGSGRETEFKKIILGKTMLENYFCPEDNCKLQVINTLKEANNSIYFMTYSFTDQDIANLIWNKNYLGLDVKGIMEKRQNSKYSMYEDLEEFTIFDKNPYTMHHKVFIIDNKTIITGSYNPTKNANEKNDENILIIRDKKIAEKYVDEFNRLYFFNSVLPEYSSEVFISEVLYNAEGSDKGKEYVEIMNGGNKTIDLGYYFLSNNKTNSRMGFNLYPGQSIKISPTFSLRNTRDVLLLKKGLDIIDFVEWGPDLNTEEGQVLRRVEKQTSQNSWIIV